MSNFPLCSFWMAPMVFTFFSKQESMYYLDNWRLAVLFSGPMMAFVNKFLSFLKKQISSAIYKAFHPPSNFQIGGKIIIAVRAFWKYWCHIPKLLSMVVNSLILIWDFTKTHNILSKKIGVPWSGYDPSLKESPFNKDYIIVFKYSLQCYVIQLLFVNVPYILLKNDW